MTHNIAGDETGPTPAGDAVEGANDFVDALLSASRAMVALAAKSLARLDADVTLPQYRALVVLATRGPQRSIDIARELGVAPSTLTRMCDRLVAKGLVRRYHRQDDRRPVWLSLTEHGKHLIGEVMRARRRDIARLVEGAGLTASKRTVQVLRSFVEAAGEIPDPQWWQYWDVSAAQPEPVAWPGRADLESQVNHVAGAARRPGSRRASTRPAARAPRH